MTAVQNFDIIADKFNVIGIWTSENYILQKRITK
jgi:hypothetical protein